MNKFKFAHLLGLNKAAKASRAEEEEEKDAEEEEETEEEDDGKSSKKGKKADGDGDDPDAEEEDDDPDAEEEDDDPDAEEEDDENKDVKKGRKAERERCAAIFGSKAAAGRPDLAATLAFTTRLSAKEAIRVMRANGSAMTLTLMETAPAKRKTLQDRMATVPQPKIGANGGKSGGGSTADVMMSLYNNVKGSDKK